MDGAFVRGIKIGRKNGGHAARAMWRHSARTAGFDLRVTILHINGRRYIIRLTQWL